MHIALLGDSTFDNGAYTEDGPDVVTHLERLLVGENDRATLLALDGAMVSTVRPQLGEVEELLADPERAPTHLALSVGGNDLLMEIDILSRPATSVAEGLALLRERSERFGQEYRRLVKDVLRLGLPTVTCSVYNGSFPDPDEARVIETALRVFDHEILEVGLDHGLPVVDLRRVCSEPEDYWNPIEPSERGGAKIAAAVLAAFRAPRYDLAGPPLTVQGTARLSS